MPALKELSYFGMSDVGHVRKNNEDAFVLMPEYGFFAIADGMGGHNGGEIAAHETLSHLCQSVIDAFATHTPTLDETQMWLEQAIAECNAYVHKLSKCNTSLSGMGTTICMTLFLENELIYAHVGDSRLYHFQKEAITPLTSDHSLVNKFAKEKN
ncbi:MAG: protein phosphatase 2C domain-containing protein, partial [Simkaniaceae bacterium]|nr:protein phosphatase 2C domain-containing protein [Simkaniaceae bacterium]